MDDNEAPSIDHPSKWETNDISTWLITIGLGQYKQNFIDERINGAFLMKIVDDEEILMELGVEKKLHRKRLAFEIERVIENLSKKPNDLGVSAKSRTGSPPLKSSAPGIDSESDFEDQEICSGIEPGCEEELRQCESHKVAKKKRRKDGLISEAHNDGEHSIKESYGSRLLPINFEISKSSKASCRVCSQRIEQGKLKVGFMNFYRSGPRIFPGISWCHGDCSAYLTPCLSGHMEVGGSRTSRFFGQLNEQVQAESSADMILKISDECISGLKAVFSTISNEFSVKCISNKICCGCKEEFRVLSAADLSTPVQIAKPENCWNLRSKITEDSERVTDADTAQDAERLDLISNFLVKLRFSVGGEDCGECWIPDQFRKYCALRFGGISGNNSKWLCPKCTSNPDYFKLNGSVVRLTEISRQTPA